MKWVLAALALDVARQDTNTPLFAVRAADAADQAYGIDFDGSFAQLEVAQLVPDRSDAITAVCKRPSFGDVEDCSKENGALQALDPNADIDAKKQACEPCIYRSAVQQVTKALSGDPNTERNLLNFLYTAVKWTTKDQWLTNIQDADKELTGLELPQGIPEIVKRHLVPIIPKVRKYKGQEISPDASFVLGQIISIFPQQEYAAMHRERVCGLDPDPDMPDGAVKALGTMFSAPDEGYGPAVEALARALGEIARSTCKMFDKDEDNKDVRSQILAVVLDRLVTGFGAYEVGGSHVVNQRKGMESAYWLKKLAEVKGSGGKFVNTFLDSKKVSKEALETAVEELLAPKEE